MGTGSDPSPYLQRNPGLTDYQLQAAEDELPRLFCSLGEFRATNKRYIHVFRVAQVTLALVRIYSNASLVFQDFVILQYFLVTQIIDLPSYPEI